MEIEQEIIDSNSSTAPSKGDDNISELVNSESIDCQESENTKDYGKEALELINQLAERDEERAKERYGGVWGKAN